MNTPEHTNPGIPEARSEDLEPLTRTAKLWQFANEFGYQGAEPPQSILDVMAMVLAKKGLANTNRT
jgi:hypothetical protein